MNAQWSIRHGLRGGERVWKDLVFEENARLYMPRHPDVGLRPTDPLNDLRCCLTDAGVGDAVFLDMDLRSNRDEIHRPEIAQLSNPQRFLCSAQ